MEPFHLADLGLLTENRAVGGILCPMAAQLCHLLLALELEDGTRQACPALRENAEKLAKATEELASAAGRLAEESGDEVLQEETRRAAEALVLAGSCVLLAARGLQAQPGDPSRREELAAAAKGVLTETAKLLQMEDAAGVRRIMQAASWLLERLSVLRDAGDMPGLLAAFRAFSEALLLLSDLTAQRLQELRDCPRRESLAQTLQLLQKCVPLLHAAKHSDLKHSRDQPVDLSQAFQLAERTIMELTSLLIDDPAHLCNGEFSAHVEAVVSYCMLLAASSRREQKLELVERCWALLQLRRSVCSHVSQQQGRPGHSWAESGLEKECHAMREEVENLEQAVLTATLCQILDTFFEGKEPLRRLVAEALCLASTGGFPAGQGGFLKKLQPLIGTFFTHAQEMLRVADFVLARCTKTQTAGEIRDQVEYLKSLLARLPPLLTEMSRDTATEQLQSLYQAWAGTTESLLRCFEETLGTREFLTLSVQEMAGHREGCEEALAGQDPEGLSRHTARLTRWAQWVVGATAHSVDRATDPMFRNGLLVWVEQLASAILELKAVAALYPERLSCLQTRGVFSKAASCLMAAARRVRDGLDGSNHPEILSPLRERVRSAIVAKALELSPPHTGLKTGTLHKDTLSCLSPPAGNLHPGMVPRKGATHPVVAALLAAARAHDVAAVSATGSALLQLSSGCVEAAKEALPVAESPQLQTLGQHQEIVSLTPRVLRLARETAARQLPHPSRLLQTALALSERICETKACLAAVAGPWYSLSQQVFGFFLAADFLRGKQAVDEAMVGLAGAVELAGDIASKGNPISPDVQESFLQVQAKFSHAQMNTRVLLETAASLEGSPGVAEASLELRCAQWAVSTRVLLGALDGFIGRDVLFLRELRNAVRNKLCWQSLLAAVSENSLRLQEAARLSSLSCPEERGRGEILALREEIEVLMEALLDAANTLSVSPLSSASLLVRFELLQRELALRAKALVLHLETVNAEQLWVIRDVLGAALSPPAPEDRESRREAFEEKAKQLMANVQWVKTTLGDVLQAASRGTLLPIAEHLLVLTSEAVGSASQHLQSRGDQGLLHLESIVWHWAAAAHCLQTRLRAGRGGGGHILQLVAQRLRGVGAQHHGAAELLPQLETCPSGSRRASGAAGEAQETQQSGAPSVSPASGPAEQEGEDSDTRHDGPSKVPRVTKDMARRMLHMTQFLRKKGPIMSKDQLVTCARKIASDGQVLVQFARIVAKHCLDERCSAELLCAAEQTLTVSSQLGIVARVKAVTAESKSSAELLVSNAQNLLRAAVHVLKAAEAACVKGLRQPPPDSEEAEVAAFCAQWRQTLLRHRARESWNPARDQLGLRMTRARAEPTLAALVQEQAPQTESSPKPPKPIPGDTVMERHL